MFVWNTFLNDARVFNEAQTLVGAGYAVTVVALSAPGVAPNIERVGAGIDVYRFGSRRGVDQLASKASFWRKNPLGLFLRIFFRMGILVKMLRFAVKMRPDVMHAHDVNMLGVAWLAAEISGSSLVYDAHEISTHREGYRSLRRLVGWLERLIMPKADGVITTTESRAKFFARAYKLPRPVVLQNRPRRLNVEYTGRLRCELGLEEDWPIIIYQGGQQPGRGLDLLMKAFVEVPCAYLVFVGGGILNNALRAQALKLGLEKRVHFIPTVALADLPSYTASAQIGVQPIENTCLNHHTTDSNKLFEYVQAEIPVIASDLPEIRKIMEKYDFGLLVPPGEVNALASALKKMVVENRLRQLYAERAREAKAELCWEAQEHLLLDLYQKLIN